MTIKEVEQLLEVPRATVRFYEKEGLLNPAREANGYRDYSQEDVERLKIIIIFRKLGLSVEDIEDLFDGAKPIENVLENNIIKLQKQMEELTGAMNLCRKMKNDAVQMETFDVKTYWNYVETEEQKGNRFADIARDIVEVEKEVIAGWFRATSIGRTSSDAPSFRRSILILCILSGVMTCLLKRSWKLANFMDGVLGVGYIILLEIVLSVPLYFLGKKYEWIRNNRVRALWVSALLFCALLIIIENII